MSKPKASKNKRPLLAELRSQALLMNQRAVQAAVNTYDWVLRPKQLVKSGLTEYETVYAGDLMKVRYYSLVDEDEIEHGPDGVESRQAFDDHGQQRGQVVCGGYPHRVTRVLRFEHGSLEERQRSLDQLRLRQSPDPLTVEPNQTLTVEDRTRRLHTREIEP